MVEKKTFLSASKGIAPFLYLTAFASLYEFVGTVMLQINTSYWFQIYTLLEFAAIYFYYFQLLGKHYKNSFIVSVIVWIIFYGISFLFWDKDHKALSLAVNSFSISLFVFFFSFCYFKDLLDATDTVLWKKPSFFYNVGFSIYYASTLLLFLCTSHFFKNGDYYYWLVNIIATLILRLLLIVGIWKTK
ncbi:hypothetical protein [Pedobacter sp. GR22-10]|uniref:hypothetical protein n=1 Tax=Pedobacter sp. GR22-10 TaxID=2994472 RepID=UPI0022455A2C|nr:hypothetical protein [Pedobacter sp. GR22-10]MCX2429582.1 hypothetical protein [Pedobacter sp. GR22-10]